MITLQQLLIGIQSAEPRYPNLPNEIAAIPLQGACLDSREVEPEDIFVALPSDHGDGHDFIAAAAARGARAMLLKRTWLASQPQLGIDRSSVIVDPEQGNWPQSISQDTVFLIAVDDPAKALYRAATYHRAQQQTLYMIGITGDIGKAGTRQILAAMLKPTMSTCKRPAAAHSLGRIAAAILALETSHQAAIFDFRATDKPQQMMELLKPQILIITNISQTGEPHDTHHLLEPYQQLLNNLQPHDWAILNYDDQEVRTLQSPAQTLWFGLNSNSDLWADQIDSRGLEGISFAAHYQGETWHIKLPLIGLHSVHTALASAAVGLILGLSWEPLISGLRNSAQLRLLSYPIVGGATLIDDSYNAVPLSGIAALNMLNEFEGRHIGIFGTLDTVKEADEIGYRSVGSRAADILDILFVIGDEARLIGEEAIAMGMPKTNVFFKASHTDAIEQLKTILTNNDIVLVKGARAAALDDIVVGLQVRDQEGHL